MLYVNFNDTNNIIGIGLKPVGQLSLIVKHIKADGIDPDEYTFEIPKETQEKLFESINQDKLFQKVNSVKLEKLLKKMYRKAGEYIQKIDYELEGLFFSKGE